MHVFEGTSDLVNPIAISLAFSDGSTVRIRGASDGESVILDDEKLQEPANWGELGGFEVSSLAEYVPPGVFGSEISGFYDVLCEGHVVGIAVQVEGGVTLCVWNYGDELYYGEAAGMLAQDWGDALPHLRPRAAGRPWKA